MSEKTMNFDLERYEVEHRSKFALWKSLPVDVSSFHDKINTYDAKVWKIEASRVRKSRKWRLKKWYGYYYDRFCIKVAGEDFNNGGWLTNDDPREQSDRGKSKTASQIP